MAGERSMSVVVHYVGHSKIRGRRKAMECMGLHEGQRRANGLSFRAATDRWPGWLQWMGTVKLVIIQTDTAGFLSYSCSLALAQSSDRGSRQRLSVEKQKKRRRNAMVKKKIKND